MKNGVLNRLSSGNTLPGNQRVGILSANELAATALFPGGDIIVDVPLNYTQLILDSYYNRAGILALHCGAAAGWSRDVSSGAGLTLGGAYTFFTSGVQGFKLGVNAGLGYAGGGFQEGIQVLAAWVGGTGDAYYVAPAAVGDAAPVDTTWLPSK